MVFKIIRNSNYLSHSNEEWILGELDSINDKKPFKKNDYSGVENNIFKIAKKEGIEIGDMAIPLLSHKWLARHNLTR